MRNKLMALILTLFTAITLFSQREWIASYAETLTDSNPPQLQSVSISPTTVSSNSQFTVTVSASDDVSGVKSVYVKITGPGASETNQIVAEITSANDAGKWTATLLMPANSESGTWRINTITITDNSAKTKEYTYGNGLTTTFAVAGTTTTYCTGRTILDTQNKDNCLWSNGAWNSLTCKCTCPTNYDLGGGGSCVYRTTSTTTSGTSSTNTSTTSGTSSATTDTNCSTSSGLNTQNENNCTWSNGSWNSSTCVCTCPTNYYPGSGGSCTYAATATSCSSSSTSGTSCTSTGGSWNATTCKCNCPTGYSLSGTACVSDVVACTSADYSAWSDCQSDGTQTRTSLNSSCSPSLATTQTCTYVSTDNCSNSSTASTACYGSSGSWSVTTCSCTCPSAYTLSGNKCVANTCSTGTASTSCTSTGGSWNATSCACACPTGYSLSGNKCVLSGSCTASSTLNTQNKNNCLWSNGSWNSSACVCTCPTNYDLGGGGSCVYRSTCSTGTVVTECTNSSGSWNATTCKCACPTNYSLSGNKCVANLSLTCTKDEWTCDSWSVCVDGKQYRPCTLSFDCPGVAQVAPRTEQDCGTEAEENTESEATGCYYKFSDYGSCVNGKQTRKVLSSYPEGCLDKLTDPLEKSCTSSVCTYKYSDWGECKDGKKTRNVTSTTPQGCIPGTPEVETSCKTTCTNSDWKCEDWGDCGSEGTQSRKCYLPETCTSASPLVSPQTSRTCVNTSSTSTTEKTEELPAECLKIGWNNKNDCELYLYQSRIVSDCRNSGLTTQDQCREYLLSKYGKPLKCQNLSDTDCNSLINNIILSDLKTAITSEVKESLSQVAGMSAVVDTQTKTITVDVTETSAAGEPVEQKKEIKVESLPITSSASEQVGVNLVSIGTTSQQQNLSPVAITFDSNQNGISDDMESRLGGKTLTEAVKKTLTGVDKAIVNGKTLEQPKYAEATTSATLTVGSVATVKDDSDTTKNTLKFEGKAKPNQVVTLFIYSTMPIVVTVKADANGNWTYELDKTMVDGTHEVYVAVNNDEGKLVETSLPTPFFIAQAQAVSVDGFVAATSGDATQVSGQAANLMSLYIFSGLAIILLLIAGFLIIKQRLASEE